LASGGDQVRAVSDQPHGGRLALSHRVFQWQVRYGGLLRLDDRAHPSQTTTRCRKNVAKPALVGLVGNCADLFPRARKRGVVPDLLTDQTSAHDPDRRHVPQGLDVATATELRQRNPGEYRRRALDSIAAHVRGMLDLQNLAR